METLNVLFKKRKTVSTFLVVPCLLICSITFGQNKFSDVIKDCIKFKQNTPASGPSHVVQFSFTISSSIDNQKTSSNSAFLDLSTRTNSFGQKVTFLKSKAGNFCPGSSTSFTAESNSSGLVITESSEILVLKLTTFNSNGSVNTQQTVVLKNNLTLVKVITIGSGDSLRSEYILSGAIDPSNPTSFIIIRFRQGLNLIEGIV